MNERFARRATWLFGIAVPVALAVLVLGPVPFMRGLGAVALVCAALGAAINARAVRAARRAAYWPVGETMTAAGLVPAPAGTPRQATPPRYRAPRIEPALSLARLAAVPGSFAMFAGRLPARMTSHA